MVITGSARRPGDHSLRRLSRRIFISCLWLFVMTILLPFAPHAAGTERAAEKVTFNFVDVELPTITKFISEITKKNFIFDERVKGKITIIAPSKLGIDEAYNLFTSVLEQKSGFTAFLKSGLVDVMLMGLGVIGIVQWKKEGDAFKVFFFVITTIFFFLFAYYGSFLNFTANFLPLRFVIFMNIVLTIPASIGISKLYDLFFIDKNLKIKCISLVVVFYLTGTLLSNPYYHLFVKKFSAHHDHSSTH